MTEAVDKNNNDYAATLGKCLVVGATGFVGRVLCKKLKQNNVHVRVLVRNEFDKPGIKITDSEAGRAWDEAVVCKLEDYKSHSEDIFQGIDTIFYLCSIAHKKASARQYQLFNVDLCESFARDAIKHKVKRFIYMSSAKAVADPGMEIIDERCTKSPNDDYGLSKRHAEERLLSLKEFEHLVILRPCLIYGPGVKANLYSLIRWIDLRVFPPLPDVQSRRSMVSVNDVAGAALLSAASGRANRKIYFIEDGCQYSVKEMESSIHSKLGHHVPRWHIPLFLLKGLAAVGDVLGKVNLPFLIDTEKLNKLIGPSLYSSSSIRNDLGWVPEDTFYSVLPDMLMHYTSHKRDTWF